jgi:hypothetical protein
MKFKIETERRKNFFEKTITIGITIGRIEITFLWRSRKSILGRFGGGWNWNLGFQAGGNTLILNLLVFSIIFAFLRKE